MPNLSDYEDRFKKRLLLVGGHGTGKTAILGSMVKHFGEYKSVIVTGDLDGLETLKSMGLNPAVVLVEDWKNPMESYLELKQYAKQGYLFCGVDDIGSVQEHVSDMIDYSPRNRNESAIRPDERKEQFMADLMQGGRKREFAQWGQLAVAVGTWYEAVHKLPFKLTAVTVLESVRENPRVKGQQKVYPLLEGAIRDRIGAKFPFVGSCFTAESGRETVYAVTSKPHPRMQSKSRYDFGHPRTWVHKVGDTTIGERLIRHITRTETDKDKEMEEERRVGAGI